MKPVHAIILSFFMCIITVETVFAQKELIVNGVIMENGSKLRIALAEITNTRNHYSVGSNDMGVFQIRAAIGDTLFFTKRGFNDQFIVLASSSDIIIYLNRGNTLNEVVIKGQSKKQELAAIEKDFRDKGSFYAGKPPIALLSPFGGSPLTFLYELFGRTPRNARRFGNYHKTELQQSHVDNFFNKTMITKNTDLEGKELEEFMIKYRPDYEVTKNWAMYDGIKWIKDSYKKYRDSLKAPLKNHE